jgi:MFS family permease
VPLLVAAGLPERRAAATLGAALGLSAPGKLLGGLAADRFGPLAAIRAALACGTLAIGLLALAPTVAVLAAFVLLYGLFVGTEVAALPALALETLGPDRFGRRFGALQLAALLAGAVGPVATGLIFDTTGRYSLAATLWGVAIGAALLLALMMRPGVRTAAARPDGADPTGGATGAHSAPPSPRASS